MPIQGHPDLSNHDPPRAKQLLMLEFGSRTEFNGPKLQYRRLCSELLGTFILVPAPPAASGSFTPGARSASVARAPWLADG